MSRVSAAFGEIISRFLKQTGTTFRAAALKSSISAAYWKDMSDGRVPSEDIIARIADCFDELDENELRVAAGYAPRSDDMNAVKAVEFALRGQKNISSEGKKQILDFVREVEERFSGQDESD